MRSAATGGPYSPTSGTAPGRRAQTDQSAPGRETARAGAGRRAKGRVRGKGD